MYRRSWRGWCDMKVLRRTHAVGQTLSLKPWCDTAQHLAAHVGNSARGAAQRACGWWWGVWAGEKGEREYRTVAWLWRTCGNLERDTPPSGCASLCFSPLLSRSAPLSASPRSRTLKHVVPASRGPTPSPHTPHTPGALRPSATGYSALPFEYKRYGDNCRAADTKQHAKCATGRQNPCTCTALAESVTAVVPEPASTVSTRTSTVLRTHCVVVQYPQRYS